MSELTHYTTRKNSKNTLCERPSSMYTTTTAMRGVTCMDCIAITEERVSMFNLICDANKNIASRKLMIDRADIEHETEGTVDEWGKVGVGRPWKNTHVKVIVMRDTK